MEAGETPTIEGLCLVTHYDINTLNDIERGIAHTSLSVIVKYAKNFISMYDASLATKGKIPSQVYVFRSKNFYGMRDVQDVNVTPVNNTMPKDVEGIIDQIPDALPEGDLEN